MEYAEEQNYLFILKIVYVGLLKGKAYDKFTTYFVHVWLYIDKQDKIK